MQLANRKLKYKRPNENALVNFCLNPTKPKAKCNYHFIQRDKQIKWGAFFV